MGDNKLEETRRRTGDPDASREAARLTVEGPVALRPRLSTG
jgi:hypothetical protein